MSFSDDYRKRLKMIIKSKGMTLSEVSYAIGRSQGYLSDVLKGKQKLSVDELELICRELNVELRDFFDSTIDSPVFLELVYEARKCDEVSQKHIVEIIKRMEKHFP